MSQDNLIKYEGGLTKQVNNAINITNKLLALSEPQLIPYRKGDKWGFCNQGGKIVIDCVYDNAFFFNEGLALIKLNNKWAFIDTEDKQIITLKVLVHKYVSFRDFVGGGDIIINELYSKVGDIVFDGNILFNFEDNIMYGDIVNPISGVLLYMSAGRGDKVLPNKCIAIIAQSNKEIPPSIFNRINNYIIVLNKYTSFSEPMDMEWI